MKFSFQEIFTSEETYLNKLKMLNEVCHIIILTAFDFGSSTAVSVTHSSWGTIRSSHFNNTSSSLARRYTSAD